mmetsp:Transcript_79620/g.165391  ORF Transcript_79620/g.165391 Transcript_79620/m.165391 type:complete len:263 (-) Transcript_79620:1057-1845(-)
MRQKKAAKACRPPHRLWLCFRGSEKRGQAAAQRAPCALQDCLRMPDRRRSRLHHVVASTTATTVAASSLAIGRVVEAQSDLGGVPDDGLGEVEEGHVLVVDEGVVAPRKSHRSDAFPVLQRRRSSPERRDQAIDEVEVTLAVFGEEVQKHADPASCHHGIASWQQTGGRWSCIVQDVLGEHEAADEGGSLQAPGGLRMPHEVHNGIEILFVEQAAGSDGGDAADGSGCHRRLDVMAARQQPRSQLFDEVADRGGGRGGIVLQ